MAKTTAPLLSFDASGQIAKTQVYSRWKGRSYTRRHVIPNNPQTSEQMLTRDVFSFLQNVYKYLPTLGIEPWEAYARGKVMTPRNAFSKSNIASIRSETDLDLLTLSPGALGGPPAASVTPTPGSGTLSLAITAPSNLPTGWTIYSAVGIAILDQDPHAPTSYVIKAGEDLTSAYVVALSGLTAGVTQYRVWLKWTRPDGSIAYSPDIGGQSTVT